MLQLGDYGAIPLDTVGTEDDVHGDDSGKQNTLEPCRQDACFHRSDSHLFLMTTPKQRRVENMLFDPAKCRVLRLKTLLTVVVEAC